MNRHCFSLSSSRVKNILTVLLIGGLLPAAQAQKVPAARNPVSLVNVFLGTSGDHGQLSPAASYPFSMMSIGPQTYPSTHTGYEHLASEFLGFTHHRFEGVGCMGSGGNLLVRPFHGTYDKKDKLLKGEESAAPGYYHVGFRNGIDASFAVYQKTGVHRYRFPAGDNGLLLDLSHTLSNRFFAEEHRVQENGLSGFIEAGTTCNAGRYKVYYYLELSRPVSWQETGDHQLVARFKGQELELRIAFSSVSIEAARSGLGGEAFQTVRQKSTADWNTLLGKVAVKGDEHRRGLFYSLLYRCLQSPYLVSEGDGTYRAIDGSLQKAAHPVYNGWAVWDNYKTQLPLLSLAYPDLFQDIAGSLANLYPYGKKDYATQREPSNTVRTEHTVVVLLDAWRKGYRLPLAGIVDSLKAEVDRLPYTSPDRVLESSYDAWALAEILRELQRPGESASYRRKALEYKTAWEKDFKNLAAKDVDKMPARGMYQGTVWQYRWSVPFDVAGLKELTGGDSAFVAQLDTFFGEDYYNHTNEPDIQVPWLYNATSAPWKAQALVRRLALDTMVQHYFNDNSRGIGSYIGPIYKNEPAAYPRTMDDDAGANSAWFVWAATGLAPACVGAPVYYLGLPLFPEVSFRGLRGKPFTIRVKNFSARNPYVKSVRLNGKPLERNWLTHKEITGGGVLEITASNTPNKSWGTKNQWIPAAHGPGETQAPASAVQ